MRHSKKIILGLFIFFLAGINISPQAYADALQWPISTNGMEVYGLAANATDNISILDCDSSHSNLLTHLGTSYSATTTNNQSASLQCNNAVDTYSQTTADGTLYTFNTALVNGQSEHRIAAVRNDKILWSTSIMSDQNCTVANGYEGGVPFSTSIGPDGNIYTLIMSDYIADCATYLAGFNARTGQQIFKQYLGNRVGNQNSATGTVWGYPGRLWTYSDRILLVDASGMEREFSYLGIENTAARYQFPSIPNTSTDSSQPLVLANDNGRVFTVYSTPWGCDSSTDGIRIRYHDLNGNSGTSSLNLGCSPDYSYKPTSDGNLAAYGNGSVFVAHMSDNNHVSYTFPIPQGYSSARVLNFWEDTTGSGILVRQLANSSGLYDVTVDDVDMTNGNLSRIDTISTNTSGYVGAVGDINGGYLYLSLCHTTCNSSTNRADNTWIHRIELQNFGTPIRNVSSLAKTLDEDIDQDGLTLSQEVSQGTSDHNVDTDSDGLDDYTESSLFANRNAVFCGDANTTCNNYPNPTQKDLYVEIDWMKNPSTNESYKPSATQLASVVNAYSTHGIYAHFDTGEYGGGQELSQYTSELKFAPDTSDMDFFNIKNGTGDGITTPSFSSSRRGIWRYMIAGYKTSLYDDNLGAFTNTYTGASYAGDDDVLIGIGRVKELAPTNQDQAISGTIMHELSHNLCLSDGTYTGQDSLCLFSGIDHFAGNDYASVMNYDKQLNMIDYSSGLNGTSDHDDWSAVMVGIDDFVTYGNDPSEALARSRTTFNKQVEK